MQDHLSGVTVYHEPTGQTTRAQMPPEKRQQLCLKRCTFVSRKICEEKVGLNVLNK